MEIGKNVFQADIPLDDKDKSYMHTIICGSDDKPALVLVPGYGSAAIMFYKILDDLSKHFRVYAFDVLGFGSSKRNEKLMFDTLIDPIYYYTDMIENFRKALNIDTFYICGHSLGGYFASLYSYYYPQHVIK